MQTIIIPLPLTVKALNEAVKIGGSVFFPWVLIGKERVVDLCPVK